MECESCGKACKELVTREGFCMTYFVDWVCRKCFKKFENKSFEDYSVEDYYAE